MKKITLSALRKKLLIKTLFTFPFALYFFWGTWAQLGVALSIVTLNLLFVVFAEESFLLRMITNKASNTTYKTPPPDYVNDPKYGYVVRNMKRRADF